MLKKLLVQVLVLTLVSSMVLSFVPADSTAQSSEGFVESEVTEQVGDIVYLSVRYPIEGAESSSLKIGSVEQNGYTIEADISGDIGSYNKYKLAFDTTAAGDPSENTLWMVGESSATIDVTRETRLSSPPIDPAAYSMKLYRNGDLFDLGQLNLQDADAPKPNKFTRVTQPTDRDKVVSAEPINSTEVAEGDSAVVRFQAQGTTAYIPEELEGESLAKGSNLDETHGVYFSLKKAESSPNARDDGELSLHGIKTYRASSSDSLNIVVNTTKYEGVDTNSELKLSLVVREENLYLPAGEYTQQFSLVERRGEFTTNWGDSIYVQNMTGQTVAGTTTLAKGSEVIVTVQNELNPPIFVKSKTEVDADGNFRTRLDFSEVPVGSEFPIKFSELDGAGSVYVGETEDPPEQRNTETETTTPPGETQNQPTDQQTQMQDPTDSTDSTSTTEPTNTNGEELPQPPRPGQPGFGVIVGVVALLTSVLLFAKNSS